MEKIKYVGMLSLRCMLFIISGLILMLVTQKELMALVPWWSIVCSICNVLTLFILYAVYKKEGLTYKRLIRWGEQKTSVWLILLGIIVVLGVGMGGMYLAGFLIYGQFPYMAPMMIAPIPLSLAIINMLILPLTTTLAEDGLYLGYLVNRLKGKVWAVVLPAFFYALQHSLIPLLGDGAYIFYRFLSFLPLTLILTYWYYKKRNPVPIMVGHFMINLATVVQIVMTSANPALYEMMKNM